MVKEKLDKSEYGDKEILNFLRVTFSKSAVTLSRLALLSEQNLAVTVEV